MRLLRRFPFIIAATSLLFSVSLAEFIFRFKYPPQLSCAHLLFRHDPRFGWAQIENVAGFGHYNFDKFISNNSDGFRDRQFGAKARPRIGIIGDSFVRGFGVNQSERFTEQLQEQLKHWEVLNLGISAYSTVQENLVLREVFDRLKLDIVVLVFCSENDRQDNRSTNFKRKYFRPYVVHTAAGELEFKGIPVPKSRYFLLTDFPWLAHSQLLLALLREFNNEMPNEELPDLTEQLVEDMARFVESRGGKFVVAVTDRTQDLRFVEWLEARRWKFLDLTTPLRIPGDGHWTPEGNQVVAAMTKKFLVDNQMLQ